MKLVPTPDAADDTSPQVASSVKSEARAPAPVRRFDRLISVLAGTFGLDRAVIFTLLARGWSSLAGIGTLTLIARYLSPAEQGYYYTFYSLVALQIVFELGFSVVILQTASHEAAHLNIAPDGSITGPAEAHARLASVLQKSVRWYTIAAILMGLVLLPLGIHFFHANARPGAQAVHWLFPWCLVVVASSCTFQIDPNFSFLEGCGYVSHVARIRLAQAVLGTLLGWTALLLHHGLFAPGLMISGQAIAGGLFVFFRRRLLLPLLRHDPAHYRIEWGREIWPFQWRIAVSWLCGYFIFQLFSPILFHYRGAVEAGQMGKSMTICAVLSALAISWLNTKAAPFGRMISRREFGRLDRAFFPALAQSTVAAFLACTAVWLVLIHLRSIHVPFALRLLPPLPLAMLFAATVMQIVVFGYALYLRAHKQEKFMLNSVLGALWTAPASLVLGRLYGALGIATGYLIGAIVIGCGLGTYTFLKYRKIWHAE